MMSLACYRVILCIFAVTWIFSNEIAGGARTDRRCINLLRRLLKNPPSNTTIAINIGLSKARYLCREGFKLVGQEVRTCKRGKWTENKEPKCLRPCGKPEDIPHSKVVGSSYNFNDQLRYRCMEGYMLKGPRLRTCGEDGKWSEAPRCQDGPKKSCSGKTGGQQGRSGINLSEDRGLDLVFVFDASVSRYYFQTSLEFAKELLRVIGASKRADRTQIAVVTEAKLEFNLGDSKVNTIDKAIKAIDNITYVGWVSSYIRALQIVKNKVAPNARNDSQQVMMFFTDGLDLSGSVRREARILRKQFEVYAIGVGRKVRIRELMGIACADENDDHVIPVRKYKSLQDAIKKAVYIKIDYSPCGESPVDLRARMVGGKTSKRGWWPWQIGLYKYNDEIPPKLQLICGGALVSRRWILTVASCFYHYDPFFDKYRFRRNTTEYLVKAGDHNLLKKERSQQNIKPEKVFVHREYKDRKFVNDIALIKLKDKVELSAFVRTLCLPEEDEGDLAIPTKYGIATGWGVTQALKPKEKPDPENRYSTRLQYSAYTIQSDELCANKSVIPINSTVAFCAGDGKGGNDTCHGDSGGAFIREGKRGENYRWVATGLDS